MTGSPAMEQADIRGVVTQSPGKVAVDPVLQRVTNPRPTGAQASKEQQRSRAQCVGIPMIKMNDHGINIDEGPALPSRPRGWDQTLASRTMLNGVAVAFLTRPKPPWRITSLKRFSPACAPSAAPTSWLSDVGTQMLVDEA